MQRIISLLMKFNGIYQKIVKRYCFDNFIAGWTIAGRDGFTVLIYMTILGFWALESFANRTIFMVATTSQLKAVP